MTKVVITDGSFNDFEIEKAILAPLGCDVATRHQITPPAELIPFVAEANAVLTQFANINADVIAAMTRAKVIVRYGVGVDNVDLEAARSKGIPVCNVPDYCLDEVADHTLALILATTRQLVPHCVGVREGRWKLATSLGAMKALSELTVGVMGFGRIGREVVRRLLAFKCRVLVHDPLVPADQIRAGGCTPVSPEELLAQSDVVTLHVPATAQNRHLINRSTISKMKPGAILINVSRGTLVDSAALIEALEQKHLSAAGLDVFDPEPIPQGSPILRMDNVIVSPHNASASEKAARLLREKAAGTLVKALRGEPLPNVVNGVTGK